MTSRPRVFPAGLLLDGERCLVVGAGSVAARKAASLIEVGAAVTVIAPEIAPECAALDVSVERRRYRRGDVAGFRLVVAATGDPQTDAAVFRDAQVRGIFANAADDPESCSMFLPAVLRRGRVTIAVATDGISPALASWLRSEIASIIGEHTELVAETAESIRSEIRGRGHETAQFDWPVLFGKLDDAARVGASRETLMDSARAWMTAELEGIEGRVRSVPN